MSVDVQYSIPTAGHFYAVTCLAKSTIADDDEVDNGEANLMIHDDNLKMKFWKKSKVKQQRQCLVAADFFQETKFENCMHTVSAVKRVSTVCQHLRFKILVQFWFTILKVRSG